MTDPVNRPEHYTYGNYECKDVLQDVLKNVTGYEAFCVGNVIKYLWRYKIKNGTQDLEKAQWYLAEAIEINKKRQVAEA